MLGVRCLLWDYLTNFARNGRLWALAGYGDLNELYCCADKNGGSLIGKVNDLRRWVDSCGMIDLGYQGPDYTWTNKRGYSVKLRLKSFML